MKSIVIRHHMLNARLMGIGGSQYVMLETAVAFAQRGFNVYIDSPFIKSRCDIAKIARFFGSRIDEDVNIGIGEPPEPRIIINTSGDVLSGPGDVLYLHYPFFLDYTMYYTALSGLLDIAGKTYSLINNIALPLFMKKVKLYIANSTFTAMFFTNFLGIKTLIINPPVNIDDIVSKEPIPMHERSNYLLIVSRISPEKRPDLSIRIAKLLKNHKMRVVLAGSVANYNEEYYKSLIEYAQREEVDDVLEIYPNISREKLVELYRNAFAYLHITPKEHFGISIVEAMAAKTPTIIPQDSGSWIDISLRDPGISIPYRSLCEINSVMKELRQKPNMWITISNNGYRRALELDKHVFRRKIFEAVSRLIQDR